MVIGRKNEQIILEKAYKDNSSHFIAVYGRRRIGKTYLIREKYEDKITFQHTGLSKGKLKDQLKSFDNSLMDYGCTVKNSSKSWLDAFNKLKHIIRNNQSKKKVIFIDELSWMDTPKSDLIIALENFWNSFASARKDIVLVICSSSTSWILNKIIHSKGGLYNRLTENIHLGTFSLSECEELLKYKNIGFSKIQILEYYMVFGGVPFYWNFVEKGLSVPQIIDKVLFNKDALLKDEFNYLYPSIFKNPQIYLNIVECLSKKKFGMTREEIIETTGLINSGDITKKLEELEACGFIRKYYSFGMKKKNAIYQLIDNFTLFYYHFIHNNNGDDHFYENQNNTPTINTWKGLSFEIVCLEHLNQIKKKLGILGVLTNINSWYCKSDIDKGIHGSQIDLLIVRKDQVINLCEIKYSDGDYTITKDVNQNLRNKINDLKIVTKTKSSIFPTLITTYGVVDNKYSYDIQSIITLSDLFD